MTDTATIDRSLLSDRELDLLHRAECRAALDRDGYGVTKTRFSECPSLAIVNETHRQEWIERGTLRARLAPKVDPVTGEILPPKEYTCSECGAIMLRPEGHRGKMPSRCEECRGNDQAAESHVCACGNEIVRATGRGKWAASCATCRDAEDKTKTDRLNATVLCECGNEIPRPERGKRASRCAACREQAKTAKTVSTGTVKVCESCSKEFTATGKGSHWVKRCPECRA